MGSHHGLHPGLIPIPPKASTGARGTTRIAPRTAFLIALGISGCGQPRPEIANTYVGRTACAECHAAEVEAWADSHHDLAMQEVSDESVLGDFDGATFTHRGVTSTFYREDGRFLLRTEGRDGELADFEVAYVFGVIPLQQYLIPFPGGRYQVLGIAWDARPDDEGGQRWFHLYPDADTGPESPFHWTRPAQNWNTTCAECHSTNLDKGFDIATRTFETTWSEIDVSCEACHGPGARHVSLAADATERPPRDATARGWGFDIDLTEAGRGWTLEPGATTATLVQSPIAREEIEMCAACHSRRATIGTSNGPGADLLDSYSVSLLREDLYHADGQIKGEVYVYGSFVQSRMYAAGVTCSDCHEPHSLTVRAEGNALCTQCHQATYYDDASHHFHEASSTGARCVECHMPETTYTVVDPRRDHSIRVPRPDLSEAIGVPNACNLCHTDRSTQWALEAVEGWFGPREEPDHFGIVFHAARAGDPASAPQLVTLASDTALPPIVRGSALSLLGAFPSEATTSVLRRSLRSQESLVRLGAMQALVGLDPAARTALALPALSDDATAIRIQAARLLATQSREAMSPGTAEAIDRAAEEFERVQLLNGDHSSAWVALGDLYADQQQIADAQAAYRTALELDSTDLVASLNHADLLRALGRDEAGEEVLFAALKHHAEAAELLHAIGLLRVRGGETEEAVDWLARAAAAGPDNPRFAYVHGVAVASAGDISRSIEILEGALIDHPFDPDLLSALTSYHRELGRAATALEYAQRLLELAPDDPEAGELVRQLREMVR